MELVGGYRSLQRKQAGDQTEMHEMSEPAASRHCSRGTQMKRAVKVALVAVILKAACFAQQPSVTVISKGSQKWPAADVDKIYLAACATVKREFGTSSAPMRPQVTLVLGADKNSVDSDKRAVLLVRWDPNLFAEGAVLLAFEDLMPVERRLTIARRAMMWADATVAVAQLSK
jgi:hypothetical protein